MKTLLGNAFSLNMLTAFPTSIQVAEIAPADVPSEAVSVVGHQDTANVFAAVLGRLVAFNRASVTLTVGDTLYVGQYSGPRLPEGASELPAGATIKWFRVTVS